MLTLVACGVLSIVHPLARHTQPHLKVCTGSVASLQATAVEPVPWIKERWPVGDPNANPRKRTAPFSGIRADFALRRATYLEDWKEGMQPNTYSKTVGATLFLYFACLAPVIAFGGAMQVATHGQLGIVETIMSRGVCGMLYAAFSGQPMTFIGPTGLTLTFTTALYAWAAPRAIPFLPMYAWVGLWTAGFLVAAACANASGLIRYCTRFTEEVFNSFLGTTYLFTACQALWIQLSQAIKAARLGALAASASAASALFSVILAALTFGLCQSSSALATSRYFSARVRNLVADFGPALAVGAVSTLSIAPAARLLAEVPRLALPASAALTLQRPLFVPLLTLPLKYRLLAAFPAFFLALLFFLDQNITVRTVNSSVNKLRPRPTYHLDLFVLGILTAAASLTGLPWMCAATVESINHIRSMTIYSDDKPAASEPPPPPSEAWRDDFAAIDSDNSGEVTSDELVALLRSSRSGREQMPLEEAARQAADVLRRFDFNSDGRLDYEEFAAWWSEYLRQEDAGGLDGGKARAAVVATGAETVVETRCSGFLTHALVLSTLSFVSLLRAVPIPVVNGVFIYLGRKVMSGNQFLERLRAIAVPLPANLDSKAESERTILVLGRAATTAFTGLQLGCLLSLWALKLTPGLGMVFPAAIGALMFLRAQLLPRAFTRRQLGIIDTPIWSIKREVV